MKTIKRFTKIRLFRDYVTPREQKKALDELIIPKAGGRYFYVNKNGNDSNDGLSPETAFLTIQKAIDESSSYSTIFVGEGTYIENINIPVSSEVSLIGAMKETTIITPETSSDTITCNANNFKISNFTIKSTGSAYSAFKSSEVDYLVLTKLKIESSSGNTIGINIHKSRWSYITEIESTGSTMQPSISITGPSGSESEFNIIHNCYFDGIKYAIWLGAYSRYNIISNNWFLNSTSQAIWLQNASLSNYIFHNIFIDNYSNAQNDGSVSNIFFENHYNDYTTDSNDDGLCDSSYSIPGSAGSYDYKPVSYPYAWLSAFHR